MKQSVPSAREQYLQGARLGFIDQSLNIEPPKDGYESEPYMKGNAHGRRLWIELENNILIVEVES